MKSADLRTRLGLSRAEWARALNVGIITVKRWEDEDTDPGGIAAAVMLGISAALEEGADPKRVGRIMSLGIGSLLRTAVLQAAAAR